MSAKKLPKAIRTTIVDMRAAASAPADTKGPPVPAASNDSAGVQLLAAPSGRATHLDLSPREDASGNANTVDASASNGVEVDPTRRRSWANNIVQRHAACSVVGGIIPLPIVNVASVTAIILRMVKVLSELYGVPFERDRARAIVIGLMGGIMPTGVGTV